MARRATVPIVAADAERRIQQITPAAEASAVSGSAAAEPSADAGAPRASSPLAAAVGGAAAVAPPPAVGDDSGWLRCYDAFQTFKATSRPPIGNVYIVYEGTVLEEPQASREAAWEMLRSIDHHVRPVNWGAVLVLEVDNEWMEREARLRMLKSTHEETSPLQM